jgi:hypothetical protein
MAIAVVLAWLPGPVAAQVVVTGPPPELRAHMDAFVKAFNAGDGEGWETMAKTVFTPDALERQTPAGRKKELDGLRAQFGTIAVTRVERNGGPDAPLHVSIKGSLKSGGLWIELDDDSRFDSVKAEVDRTADEDRHH